MKDKKLPNYAQLVTILKDKYENGSLVNVYIKLKERYLSSPDTFRDKAAGNLLPEDTFGDDSLKGYISLSPESLRGKIAKITHGYEDKIMDQILGITFPTQAGEPVKGGQAKRRRTRRKLTRRIKKHIKKYTKKYKNKSNKKSNKKSKTKKGKKNKKHRYTR